MIRICMFIMLTLENRLVAGDATSRCLHSAGFGTPDMENQIRL